MSNLAIAIAQFAAGISIVIDTYQVAELLTKTGTTDYRTLVLLTFGAVTCMAAIWGLEGRKE
jgi:hypothetical protein